MHYYKFNIGDYASHTQHLDPIEDIAYRRMLDWYYLHESPLPDSPEQIGRLIRMRSHSDSIAVVLQEFFELTEYGWRQSKADKEISSYQAKSKKAKASAEARWSKKTENVDANALRTDSERNANHKPLTNNHKPRTSKQNNKTQPSGFDLSSWPQQPSEQVWKDFVKHRNAVKAKLSQTVINRMTKKLDEMVRRGWTVDDVLSTICEKGWRSFEVEWLVKDQPQGQIFDQETPEQQAKRLLGGG